MGICNIGVMIKPVSSSCKMHCDYCFYADIAGSRSIANYGSMSEQTAHSLIENIFRLKPMNVSFAFQGGEPTLWGAKNFMRFIDKVNEVNTYGARVEYAIQTNGLEISEDMLEVLKNNSFLVGVSLDGPKSIHDRWRKDVQGQGTFKRVLRSIRLLEENKIKYNILSVVTKQACENVERIFNFYVEQGFRYLQYIACIDELDRNGDKHEYELEPDAYGMFLCRLYDLWEEQYCRGDYISIRQFDNYIYLLRGEEPENCAMRGRCTNNIVIEADGGVYPCDFYVLDEYRLGNIHDISLKDILNNNTFASESRAMKDCANCEFSYICRGGCKRDCVMDESGEMRNCFCRSYKKFFRHSLSGMKRIAGISN